MVALPATMLGRADLQHLAASNENQPTQHGSAVLKQIERAKVELNRLIDSSQVESKLALAARTVAVPHRGSHLVNTCPAGLVREDCKFGTIDARK
jgi:hypothetical protein